MLPKLDSIRKPSVLEAQNQPAAVPQRYLVVTTLQASLESGHRVLMSDVLNTVFTG